MAAAVERNQKEQMKSKRPLVARTPAVAVQRIVRPHGKRFMDVTLRIRILLPKKEKYPIINRPWIKVIAKTPDGKIWEGHNFRVLGEILAPHAGQMKPANCFT